VTQPRSTVVKAVDGAPIRGSRSAAAATRTRYESHTGSRPPPHGGNAFRVPALSGLPGRDRQQRRDQQPFGIGGTGRIAAAATRTGACASPRGRAHWHQGSWCNWLVSAPPSLPGALPRSAAGTPAATEDHKRQPRRTHPTVRSRNKQLAAGGKRQDAPSTGRSGYEARMSGSMTRRAQILRTCSPVPIVQLSRWPVSPACLTSRPQRSRRPNRWAIWRPAGRSPSGLRLASAHCQACR
jgi:hypothetical protein